AVWEVAFFAGQVVIPGHQVLAGRMLVGALLGAPAYLLNPAVGWLSARTLRRQAAALDAAGLAAVNQAGQLAAAAEHARHARALHDRVLQTMETLARGHTIPDEALRARIVEQTAWLRRFIETGQVNQDEDLAAGLAAAARVAGRAGIRVQLNDARLRGAPDSGGLAPAQREAPVHVVPHAISAIARSGAPLGVPGAP